MRAYAAQNDKRIVRYQGKFLRFIERGSWEFSERCGCSGIVIILPVTTQNEVIFIEQFRIPLNKKVIEFPAGLANDRKSRRKESLVTAAKRELFEETGYRAQQWVKLIKGPTSSGSSADIVHLFLAKGVRKTGKGGGDDLESIVDHKVPLEKVDEWLKKKLRQGCLVEPKIYAGLYFIKEYNKTNLKRSTKIFA